jgi:hypothetical protein
MKIKVTNIKAVKVKLDGDEFTANLRVLPMSASKDMQDVELVQAMLQDVTGAYREDAFGGVEVEREDGTFLQGVELTAYLADQPQIISALGGAYTENFRNMPLRSNIKQSN